jgi:hypothetical protein
VAAALLHPVTANMQPPELFGNEPTFPPVSTDVTEIPYTSDAVVDHLDYVPQSCFEDVLLHYRAHRQFVFPNTAFPVVGGSDTSEANAYPSRNLSATNLGDGRTPTAGVQTPFFRLGDGSLPTQTLNHQFYQLPTDTIQMVP